METTIIRASARSDQRTSASRRDLLRFFAPLRELILSMGFKKPYLPWIGAVPAPSAVPRSKPRIDSRATRQLR